MYASLAARDRSTSRAAHLRELADYEEKHAEAWRVLLERLGSPVPPEGRFLEHRILVGLARVLGVGRILPILHKQEVDGVARYKAQAARWRDPDAQAAFADILADEIAHEVDTFNAMRETEAEGGRLRSAVLGANDGLGSLVALVAGVAGATASSLAVLIAGVAGLVAGAVSMAASNYISVKAEQEVYRSQVSLQQDALEVAPEAKRTQLEEVYRRKGLTQEEAETVVGRLAGRPEELLRSLVAEQHGLAEASFEDPSRLALITGTAFALAGAVPILPFLFLASLPAVLVSVGVTAGVLFLTGVLRSLFTLNPFLRSGLEMVLIGLGAAAATYLVGLAVGGVVG